MSVFDLITNDSLCDRRLMTSSLICTIIRKNRKKHNIEKNKYAINTLQSLNALGNILIKDLIYDVKKYLLEDCDHTNNVIKFMNGEIHKIPDYYESYSMYY